MEKTYFLPCCPNCFGTYGRLDQLVLQRNRQCEAALQELDVRSSLAVQPSVTRALACFEIFGW